MLCFFVFGGEVSPDEGKRRHGEQDMVHHAEHYARTVMPSGILAAVNLALLSFVTVGHAASAHEPANIEVAAVYYPHWHRYPKGDEWFGDRFDWSEGEWTFVKTAKPRFPGHHQPLVPVAGYLKGDSPEDVEKEIALASNAGIDVFIYDYYWYGGKTTQDEALDEGFLKAKNRDRMKFALMWCYHERNDAFRPKLGCDVRRRLMSLAHTPD